MKLRLLTLFAALACAAPATGQQIYKCAGGVYSQTPCAGGKAPQKIYRYTPVPDSPPPPSYYAAPAPASAPPVAAQPSYQQPAAPSGDPHIQEKLRAIATDSAYKGSPSARRAAMSAALQEAGYAPASQYAPPGMRSPTDGIGQPANVIDPRTSMPINGAIKVAPNLIWDPATGQYIRTY